MCWRLLYAWRECRHNIGEFLRNDHFEYGSTDYWAAEADRMEEEEVRRFEEEDEPWWVDL